MMRSPDEIQQAHDVVHAALDNAKLLSAIIGSDIAPLAAAASVLCWALQHPIGPDAADFGELLASVREILAAVGQFTPRN
jgi:hypothetical protein